MEVEFRYSSALHFLQKSHESKQQQKQILKIGRRGHLERPKSRKIMILTSQLHCEASLFQKEMVMHGGRGEQSELNDQCFENLEEHT